MSEELFSQLKSRTLVSETFRLRSFFNCIRGSNFAKGTLASMLPLRSTTVVSGGKSVGRNEIFFPRQSTVWPKHEHTRHARISATSVIEFENKLEPATLVVVIAVTKLIWPKSMLKL
jgi:hypothetical protein